MPIGTVAVLVNPRAGSGRASTVGRRVVEVLRARGMQVRELVGSSADESETLARQAVSCGVDALVGVGGDGIVHLALQAVAQTPVVLGVVPCGSGNDFARSLGLPLRSPAAAVGTILAGHSTVVDLGRAGDRWFGAVLAAGFDSRVNDRGNRMRVPRGRTRYHLAMIAELAAFRPIDFSLTLDGELQELPAMLVAVGNGSSYGGGMKICPAASMGDGLLDVTVVTSMSRASLIWLFPSVYSGRHVRRPEVRTFRAATVRVAAADVSAYADGESLGALPLDCVSLPGAVRVFTDR